MIKTDIINNVAKAADITRIKAVTAVEAVLDAMKESMKRGERIELRGFGVFQVKPRKKGIGRNPRTGYEVRIPPARQSASSRARTCEISSSSASAGIPRAPSAFHGPHSVLAEAAFHRSLRREAGSIAPPTTDPFPPCPARACREVSDDSTRIAGAAAVRIGNS